MTKLDKTDLDLTNLDSDLIEPTRLDDASPDSSYIHGQSDQYVISSALNNVKVAEKAADAFLDAAEFWGATAIVGTERYKDPTGIEESEEYESSIWWDSKLNDYYVNQRLDLFNDRRVWVDGHLRHRATIAKPLQIYTNGAVEPLRILPSAKLQAIPRSRPVTDLWPSYLATTGSLTPYSYSHTRTGYKASKSQKLGFIRVNQRSDGFFTFRQVEMKTDGSFYDWKTHRTAQGDYVEARPDSLFLPDLHAESMSPKVRGCLLDLVRELRPRVVYVGDIVDTVLSHHTSPMALTMPRKGLVEGIEEALTFLAELTDLGSEVVVIPSNHHDHVDMIVENTLTKGCKYPQYWSDLAYLANQHFQGEGVNLLHKVANDLGYPEFRWLPQNAVEETNGVAKIHGHKFVNGARGSMNAYLRSGHRVTHGHQHYGYRMDDVFGAGAAIFNSDTEYADYGFTNWTVSAVSEYADGSRQLLTLINWKWT